MKFYINYNKENIGSLMRKIGYIPTSYSFSVENEYNFIKPLSNSNYPRFHIYVKKDDEKNAYAFNLHLDSKKPSYKGSPAHSGEYEGDLIEKEINRIKKIIN